MRVTTSVLFGAAAIGIAAATATLAQPAPRYYGVYRAIVTEAADPQGRRRVKITVPAISGTNSLWAERALPISIPANEPTPQLRTGSEVVVAFEAGDAERPVVLGAVWSRD